MIWFFLAVLLLVALAVVGQKLKQPEEKVEGYPYSKKSPLFTPAERSFLGVLDQAVGEEYRIFGKVRVADIVDPQKGLGASGRQRALNRISSKHFDFVLCRKDDLSVVGAVELDDQSHQQRKRQERDAFLTEVCRAIDLPLLQIPAQRGYSVAELRERVLAAVRQAPAATTGLQLAPPPAVAPIVAQAETPSESAQPAQSAVRSEALSCPKCGAPMVRRRAKAGDNAGQGFWGCSTFPKCRGIVQDTDGNAVVAEN